MDVAADSSNGVDAPRANPDTIAHATNRGTGALRAALISGWRTSVFLNHHLGRLYHRGDLVAFLELHLLGAELGDDRFDDVVSDLDRD